jgi:hypothetical protein
MEGLREGKIGKEEEKGKERRVSEKELARMGRRKRVKAEKQFLNTSNVTKW